MAMSWFRVSWWVWVALAATPSLVQAQLGVDLCACTPSVYTFQLNFSAVCDIETVYPRPGVENADCFARGIGTYADDTTDFVPVEVSTITIGELNKDQAYLVQTPYADRFQDGDKVTYTSILGTPEAIAAATPDNIPRGLQIEVVGINKIEQPIANVWIILFDNDCGIFPVLKKGDQIGWTIIDDIRLPFQSVCPIAGSVAPTPSPKTPTTMHPSSEPSNEPSNAPIEATLSMDEPTFHPSEAPSEEVEAPVCVVGKAGKGKGGKGKSGMGKSGKSGSGKSGDGKSGSGKSGDGKSGSGKSGGITYHDGYTPTTRHASIRDFYRFGVSPLSAGSHAVDRDYRQSSSRDSGKGSYVSKSESDDDDEECLPPKKKKVNKNSSQKKLKKKGKAKGNGKDKKDSGKAGEGKAGKGKSGKGYSDDDNANRDPPNDEDLMHSGKGSGKGKSGKGGPAEYTSGKGGKSSGKGGKTGGKAGSKHGDGVSPSDRISKKLEDRDPARKTKAKLAKRTSEARTDTSSAPTKQPVASTSAPVETLTSAPVETSTSAPVKAPTSAPSLSLGSLNMHLLQNRISHWFNEHADPPPDSDLDRRSLRQ